MNRRGFFASIIGALSGSYLGRFLPDVIRRRYPSGMERQISASALQILCSQLAFNNSAFTMIYPKIGDTINVRRPARFKGVA